MQHFENYFNLIMLVKITNACTNVSYLGNKNDDGLLNEGGTGPCIFATELSDIFGNVFYFQMFTKHMRSSINDWNTSNHTLTSHPKIHMLDYR